jgi:hypothetical protein
MRRWVSVTRAALLLIVLAAADTTNKTRWVAPVVASGIVLPLALTRSQEGLLDFPNSRLAAHTEFEVFLSNGIPVLVDHHDAEEHAESEEEEPVDVVFDSIADCHAEGEEDNLRDSEEGGAKENVTDRPPVVECADHEDELGDDVNEDACGRPDKVDDPKGDRVCVVEASKAFERRDGDEEPATEQKERRQAENLWKV